MTFKFNGRTLLEMAACPIDDEQLGRLVALIDQQQGDASAFIARWSPTTGVCFTGSVVDGELVGWMMFPAQTEEAARYQAAALYVGAREAVLGALDPARQLAADAINKASRH